MQIGQEGENRHTYLIGRISRPSWEILRLEVATKFAYISTFADYSVTVRGFSYNFFLHILHTLYIYLDDYMHVYLDDFYMHNVQHIYLYDGIHIYLDDCMHVYLDDCMLCWNVLQRSV